MASPNTSLLLPALVLALLVASGGCQASSYSRAIQEGTRLYELGDYEAALPLLEQAAVSGVENGEMFYRLAYLYDINAMPDRAQDYRERALPLLVQQVDSEKATLETYYYLTALYANLGDTDEMRRTAEAGLARFGESSLRGGADWFRLGRLHQFIQDEPSMRAAYGKAVEIFEEETAPNPVLHSLALLADGDTDLVARRYQQAAEKFEKATRIHAAVSVSPFRVALAHLGSGNFEVAAAAFAQVREEGAAVEAQYGADVARRLAGTGGLLEVLEDGQSIHSVDDASLQVRIEEAAQSLRTLRQEAEAGADNAEAMRGQEQVFFTLLAEQMLRGTPIREPSLAGGYADLIRRR